jgi:hypothetical protein
MDFQVQVDPEDIDKDGFVYVDIDEWDIKDACADYGGCCDELHINDSDDALINLDLFEENLSHYYFQQNMPQDSLYQEILYIARKS